MKSIEIAFTNRFLPIIELSVGKRYIQQNSLKPSFTIFLAFVDRYFSLSESFVVRPGVYNNSLVKESVSPPASFQQGVPVYVLVRLYT